MRIKLLAAGLLAALLYHFALPPSSVSWLGWLCLLPLFLALEVLRPDGRRAGLWLALPFGLLFNILTFRWMTGLAAAADITVSWIMYPAVLLWSLYLTLYPWFFVRLFIWLRPRLGGAVFLAAPFLWIVLEWLRGSGLIAFSWVHIAQTQTGPNGYLAPAAFVGGLGLGWLMVLGQSALAALIGGIGASIGAGIGGGPGPRRLAAGVLALTLLLLFLPSLSRLPETAKRIRVAAVQGNISLEDKWEPHYRMENLRIFRDLSREAVGEDVELLVWPETAFPVSLLWDRHSEDALRRCAMNLGAEILTGFQGLEAAPEGGYRHFNAAGLLGVRGSLEGVYYKQHLLPFGERIPLVDLLAPGLTIDLGQSDFTPGPGVRVLQSEVTPLSVFICYEMGFAASVRRSVEDGARLLVNITNDGWFDHPLAMELHAALTPMRAAENGLPAIRCGNNGVTCLVDARGGEIARLPVNIRGKLIGELEIPSRPSFYGRHGGWFCPVLLLSYGLLLALLAVPLRRMSSSAFGSGSGVSSD